MAQTLYRKVRPGEVKHDSDEFRFIGKKDHEWSSVKLLLLDTILMDALDEEVYPQSFHELYEFRRPITQKDIDNYERIVDFSHRLWQQIGELKRFINETGGAL